MSFKVIPYKTQGARCLGCHMDSCSGCNCSCHRHTETVYDIEVNGKIVSTGHYSRPTKESYTTRLRNEMDWLRNKAAGIIEEYEKLELELREVEE